MKRIDFSVVQNAMSFSWILFIVGIQYSVGGPSPKPLVSQSGMMPMHSSAAPVVQIEEVKPPVQLATLAKRQDPSSTKDLTDQQLDLLLNSFPNDETPATDPPPIVPIVPTMPIIIVSNHQTPKSAQTFYYDPPPAPVSFSAPMISMENPSVVFDNPKTSNQTPIRFVDTYDTSPKPTSHSHGRKLASDLDIIPNEVKAEAIEKDIFAQSVKEDINRQVVNPTAKQNDESIDHNLLQRQAKPKKTAPAVKNETAAADNDEEKEKHPLFEHPSSIGMNKRPSGTIPFYKPGPPWEDEKVVGKAPRDEMPFLPTQISHKVATKLCMLRKRVADTPPFANKPKKFYLWAPINQYVPLVHKGYPMRSPIFAPQCLKWVLRPCRGELRRPLVKPCTYWMPAPIRRPECGFLPNIQTKIVNYRPTSFVPGNCPCIWPCTKRFDPIQRCRVETSEMERHVDPIHSDGDPWHEGEIKIQDFLASQLCRALKLALTTKEVIPIGWIPLRIESIDKMTDPNDDIVTQKENDGDSSSHFRRKRAVHSIQKKAIEAQKVISSIKKKRQTSKKSGKKFYNPDAILEPSNNGLAGRTLKGSKPTEEEEWEEEGFGHNFAALSSYDPDQYKVQPSEDTDQEVPTCIEWRYKSCPKGKSSEELHLAQLEDDANKVKNVTEEGKKPLRRRSSNRHKRRRANLQKRRIDGEGHGRIIKRHDENDDSDFNNILAIHGSIPELGCSEWHYTESQHCIKEERVGTAAKMNQIMITGVIESNEEDEDDDDYDIMDVVQRGDVKTVKNLCPGTPVGFPCFLKRKKRDANDGNSTNMEGEEAIQDEPLVNFESAESDLVQDDAEQTAKDNANLEMKEGNGQSSSIFYANQVQMNPDSACMCDWPCLPFFDKINRCYDEGGNVIDAKGKIIFRSFRRSQRSPVACINFVETDEIYCKVKDKLEK